MPPVCTVYLRTTLSVACCPGSVAVLRLTQNTAHWLWLPRRLINVLTYLLTCL